MLKNTGVPTPEDIAGVFPTAERLSQGPVAVIECYQKIPCNPCFTACKLGAITPFEDINDLPNFISEKCTGCGLCIAKCPGLAIMVIDGTYSDTEALMKIPYEFRPLPAEGAVVKGVDREGQYVDDVRILKVQNPASFDRTPVLWIAMKKEHIQRIRNIQLGGHYE